jgi:aminoglycoside phosphotransferase family enzyme
MSVEPRELAAVATAHDHSTELSSEPLPVVPLDLASTNRCYKIEDTRQSECALVLFTQHEFTPQRLVMKILREYSDTRYSLETVGKRQQCQLEALKRNKVFTPEVYVGLAPIDYFDLPQGRFHISEIMRNPAQVGISHLDLRLGSFRIGEIIQNPTKDMLDPHTEYALIMEELPQNRRLDNLLDLKDESSLRHHVRLLTKHIAQVHRHLASPITPEDGLHWGSYEQLQKKLTHNFGLLDPVLVVNDERSSNDGWRKKTLVQLKETLLQIFMRSHYSRYFERRIQGKCIKSCHGDLKCPNIWILPLGQGSYEEPSQCIKILDAIDFNPTYSNIDTLSDFAMLIIDIQTRMNSADLANEMIRYYLELTDQDDEVAKAVLNYYLVEKAIVGAAISIVYDNLPDFGLSLVKVAEMRLNCLIDRRF